MEPTTWCLEKNLISLVEPSTDLKEAYPKKARRALAAMERESDDAEWEIVAAYYAMYFSLYAICVLCGIKSISHSCTIGLIRSIFRQRFSKEDYALMLGAKKLRIAMQYYDD